MEIKFGTDGWRGMMARDFTYESVRKVAQAIADYLKTKPPKTRAKHTVIVGYDWRFQSEAFADEIARVMEANGHSAVLLAQALPTPAVSYLSHKLKSVGVVVTASHNPPAYNGVKIKLEGRAAPETVTAEVESLLDRANPARGGEPAVKSYKKDYLDYLRSRINPAGFISRLPGPAVIDYMHGTAGGLLGEMARGQKRIIEMNAGRDPLFGGANPEPIEKNLQALKQRVLKEGAAAGIALDGDGDRFAAIDDKGRYLSPCQIYPMLLEYLIGTRGIRGKIVQSVSMGYLSGRIAKAYNLPFAEVPVGFKHIADHLAQGQAAFGGEESGGYAWKGGIPERDGLLASLAFLEMIVKRKKKPSELWAEIEKKYGPSSFRRVDFQVGKPVADKAAFAAKIQKKLPQKIAGTSIKATLSDDGIKVILEDDHWLLMRPSGTEPLIRTYAESDSPKRTQTLLEMAAKWVNAHL
ncbi:MAG: phosphoglucomutase/phosphomannomutase family protein [Elusimicrobia bacterium]|nr:phosphoglucomutase/phosphomannomutase family protein [Elusimicrobiota bacterium]